eukprot:5662184-Amphidinium_carterae.1
MQVLQLRSRIVRFHAECLTKASQPTSKPTKQTDDTNYNGQQTEYGAPKRQHFLTCFRRPIFSVWGVSGWGRESQRKLASDVVPHAHIVWWVGPRYRVGCAVACVDCHVYVCNNGVSHLRRQGLPLEKDGCDAFQNNDTIAHKSLFDSDAKLCPLSSTLPILMQGSSREAFERKRSHRLTASDDPATSTPEELSVLVEKEQNNIPHVKKNRADMTYKRTTSPKDRSVT